MWKENDKGPWSESKHLSSKDICLVMFFRCCSSLLVFRCGYFLVKSRSVFEMLRPSVSFLFFDQGTKTLCTSKDFTNRRTVVTTRQDRFMLDKKSAKNATAVLARFEGILAPNIQFNKMKYLKRLLIIISAYYPPPPPIKAPL